jgi:tetratricopeptide (TPR) repeat protein
MHYLTLGQKLRMKRKELNLTLKDVAGDYISTATISLVERDLQNPSDELLRYLSEKLQTPISYFRETPEETLSRRANSLLAESEALLYRKRYSMAARFAEEILADARELKSSPLIARACLLLARIYLEQQAFSQANACLFEAQTAALHAGNLEWLPQIYYTFGLVSFSQGFYPQALDYFKQAEQADPAACDDEGKAKIYAKLGETCHKLGQYDEALHYAGLARDSLSRLNDMEAYADSLILLGASYREKEQYEQAQYAFQEALRLMRQLDAKRGLADVDQNLAAYYMKTGDLEKADEHFKLAIDQMEQLGDPSAIPISLAYVELLILRGDLAAAQERLNATLKLLERCPSDQERARALALMFQLHHLQGDEEASRAALEESLEIVRKQPMPRRMADMLVRLGRICASSGDVSAASLLFTEALTVYENLGLIMNQMMML